MTTAQQMPPEGTGVQTQSPNGIAQPLTSAFKPSFPNPAVWTDELTAQRRAEFEAFEKTPEGIAEQRAFDEAYTAFEMQSTSAKGQATA